MSIADEHALLANLFAEPSLAKSLLIKPDEFERSQHQCVFQALRQIDPVVFSVPLAEQWLKERHYDSAVPALYDVARHVPTQTTIEKVLALQGQVRNAYRKRALLKEFALHASNPNEAYDDVIKSVFTKVSELTMLDAGLDDCTFDAIKAKMEQSPNRDSWRTGIEHIDAATEGMARGEIWILNAPYKGSKTRTALNIVLNTLMAGRSVLYVTYDGTGMELLRSLYCIYTDLPIWCFSSPVDRARYDKWAAYESSQATAPGVVRPEDMRLPRPAVKAGLSYHYGKPLELDEIQERVAHAGDWTNASLRILDSRQPIRDLGSLSALVMADRLRYNTDLVVVDYVQGITESKEYEALAEVAGKLQRLAVEQQVCLLEISQMSNEDIKSGPGSKKFGTKGSGDFPATCDFGVEVSYNADDTDPFAIAYVLKVARRAPRLVDRTYINPMSGRWTGYWQVQSFGDWIQQTKGVGAAPVKKNGR